jgi:hypothetical protein
MTNQERKEKVLGWARLNQPDWLKDLETWSGDKLGLLMLPSLRDHIDLGHCAFGVDSNVLREFRYWIQNNEIEVDTPYEAQQWWNVDRHLEWLKTQFLER